jgi:hypothetical protein
MHGDHFNFLGDCYLQISTIEVGQHAPNRSIISPFGDWVELSLIISAFGDWVELSLIILKGIDLYTYIRIQVIV